MLKAVIVLLPIKPLEPFHDCCSFCSKTCKCGGVQCDEEVLPFEETMQEDSLSDEYSNVNQREVTTKEQATLKETLCEVLNDMKMGGLSLDESLSHGFSMQLIEDITNNCETIFTVQDLTVNFPVFSFSNSLRILEVIQEVFMDSFLNLHLVHEIATVNTRVHGWFDFDHNDFGVESESESELLEL